MTQYLSGQIITDQNLNANGAQVDSTQFSGTPTSLTQESNLWDIPAGAAVASSTWRLTVVGQSVMGGTSVVQNYYAGYGPTGVTQAQLCTTGSTNVPNQPASSTWFFTVSIYLMVLTTGAGGTAIVMGRVDGGQVPNNSVVDALVGGVNASFNTTVDNKLCFLFSYSASTGTPVVTTFCSAFERLS